MMNGVSLIQYKTSNLRKYANLINIYYMLMHSNLYYLKIHMIADRRDSFRVVNLHNLK